MKAILKPLNKTELGIQKKVPGGCKSPSTSEKITISKEKSSDDLNEESGKSCELIEKINDKINSPGKNEERTSLVAFDYNSSSGDESED